jgi:hypothetical protein
MAEAKAAHVAEFDALEVLPEALPRIEFRGIRRQAFHMEALGGAVGEEVLDDATAMNWCPIPDDQKPARHLAQEMLQKRDDVFRGHGVVLAMKVQLPLWGDGADGREMVTGPPLAQDRGLARRGVGADDTGQGIKARFVDEEDGLLLGRRPFLSAGQVCWCQRAMAPSSRWRAHRAGFCGLQCRALSRRPTCTGW